MLLLFFKKKYKVHGNNLKKNSWILSCGNTVNHDRTVSIILPPEIFTPKYRYKLHFEVSAPR